MEDRAKKRREYLRKKATVLSALWTARIIVVAGVIFSVVMLLWLLVILNYIPYGLFNNDVHGLAAMLLKILLALIFCPAIVAASYFVTRDQSKKARAIQHVPPVRNQIDTLPAEELLLRGSTQPTVEPDELLRAANTVTEPNARELLKPR